MEVITVNGVTKRYRFGVGRARVREMTPPPFDRALARMFPTWWTKDTFDALQDVSLSVRSGDALGIVGHNGAGKTTLLKVIAGVTEPTTGRVHTSGRTAALIDLLVGFHPDLTGRENVYLLGSAHGFRRKQMEQKVDQILDFAEIDQHADTQLKRFSAGMAARLGFATVSALEVDVLLVDEVLAVGDTGFQRKCIGWLDEFQGDGGTLVFISHNMSLVRNMTERVVWLDHGRMLEDGKTADVLARYSASMERRDAGPPTNKRKAARKMMRAHGLDRWGAGGARVEEAHIEQTQEGGASIDVSIHFEADELKKATFYVGFVDEEGREIGAAASPLLPLAGGGGVVHCRISPPPFWSGVFFPVIGIVSDEGIVCDRWKLDRPIVVEENGHAEVADTFGPVRLVGEWDDR